ncbi:PEP-CTERM sorting domain-containing protein [Nitrosomonas sp.]|uniref:PEP-CTERM sorting domain-containing protein n=1 Tax=Nitrosomonas sp. TaxID=42353 RepID=UPI0025F94A23|nr:PEP-CTERM sorting domain-containing protein [Nitrosomonas sp.]
MNSRKILLQACALALATASTGALAGAFPTVLSGNTTGLADSIFLGAPDDTYVGLGVDEVTYDFGLNHVVNRVGLVDLNVYEVDTGVVEFGLMDILVSQDGITFESIKASQVALERITGDSVHSNNSFGKSYDLGSFDWVRYVKIDGTGSGRAGSTNGFDLDAIGVHEVTAIPEPSTWAMMLGGLLALAGVARRQRS